jgi:hypothetical protein
MSDESGRTSGTLPYPRTGRDAPRRSSLTSLLKLLVVLLALLVAVGAVSALAGTGLFFTSLLKPKTIDRSTTVVQSVQTIHEYHAATAHLEVVVNSTTKYGFLPTALIGEQKLFVGVGTVDAMVDFGKLDAQHVTVSDDHKSVTIALPAPTLGQPVLDIAQSYVYDDQRGIGTRLGNLVGGQSTDKSLYTEAIAKMTGAAQSDADIIRLGEANTTAMLRGLLGAVGYTNVTVNYAEPTR